MEEVHYLGTMRAMTHEQVLRKHEIRFTSTLNKFKEELQVKDMSNEKST